MAVFGYGYVHAAVLPGFVAARRGLAAVVIALLLGTMERLANQTLQSPAARALAVLSFVIVLAVPGVLLWVVVGSGLLGMLVYRERPT
jgi:chromate transport protein ChrA